MASPSASGANSSAETPGRPSGVSPASSSRSIPASHLQPITDVAKPVSVRAACPAQAGVSAVITIRAPHIVNASANVSSTSDVVQPHHAGGPAGTRRAGSSSHGSLTG